MVHCVIVRCNSYRQSKAKKLKTDTKDYSFFKIPKVRLHECRKAKELSERGGVSGCRASTNAAFKKITPTIISSLLATSCQVRGHFRTSQSTTGCHLG